MERQTINKLFMIILIILCSTFIVQATKIRYMDSDTDNSTKIWFIDKEMNKTRCWEILNNIPSKYYEGVYNMRFKKTGSHRIVDGSKVTVNGRYYWITKNIHLYKNCNAKTIIHELAHHQQKLLNDTLKQAIEHTGRFNEFNERIDAEYMCARYDYACWRVRPNNSTPALIVTTFVTENVTRNATFVTSNITGNATSGIKYEYPEELEEKKSSDVRIIIVLIVMIMGLIGYIIWIKKRKVLNTSTL